MIDPTIEKALAPSKEEWKYPLWTRLKNYAIGFGSAVLVVALLLSVIYLWKGSETALAPQTELPKTAVVAPVQNQFVEPNKKVKPTVKKAEVKPTVKDYLTTEKPKAKPIDMSPIDNAPIPPSPPFPPN